MRNCSARKSLDNQLLTSYNLTHQQQERKYIKTVEILLAIINGLIDSLAKIISRTIDYILKKLTDCFDLEENGIKYLSFLLTVVIGFFCFCIYKTCTTPNTITHCAIEYVVGKETYRLDGVRQWMRPDNNLGYYKTFDEALQKSKTINCKVGN